MEERLFKRERKPGTHHTDDKLQQKKEYGGGTGKHNAVLGIFYDSLIGCAVSADQLHTQLHLGWGWMLMFAVWPVISYRKRQNKPKVVTYTDKVISQVWLVMGYMFIITFLTIGIMEITFARHADDFLLMLPLSLVYCGLGTSITGIIIQERWMTYAPSLRLL